MSLNVLSLLRGVLKLEAVEGLMMKLSNFLVACASVLVFGTSACAANAQSTTVVVDPRLKDLCYSGHENPVDENYLLWEEDIGHPIPLDKQEAADKLMGGDASLRKLSSSEAAALGARRGDNYLVAVCVAGTPPVHSKEAFEDWGVKRYVDWNIDNRFNRVLTIAGGMGGGPEAARSLIYYSFPSKFTLDNHDHALTWTH